MVQLDDMQAMALDTFLAANWAEFEQHCQHYDGCDPDEISEKLVGR